MFFKAILVVHHFSAKIDILGKINTSDAVVPPYAPPTINLTHPAYPHLTYLELGHHLGGAGRL